MGGGRQLSKMPKIKQSEKAKKAKEKKNQGESAFVAHGSDEHRASNDKCISNSNKAHAM